MSWYKFWRNTGFIFIIGIRLSILLAYIVFVLLPKLAILPVKRSHIRNSIKRKLMKQGMPKELAKEVGKKYTENLAQYGSVGGIIQTLKKARKNENDTIEVDEDLKVEKSTSIQINSVLAF